MAIPESKPESLGHQAAAGFVWLLVQTLSVKVATVAGQIVLARLLAPSDFGLVALAYSVIAFISIFQSSCLREILIQREREFRVLAGPAFWLSLAVGSLLSVLIAGLAPTASKVLQQPDLPGLLLVLAGFTFITNFEAIPNAKLQNEMRFRALSSLGIFQGIGQIFLSVVLAANGFGAYSFVIPLPVMALVKVVILWSLARPPLSWQAGFRYWPGLMRSSGFLIGAAFFMAIKGYGASLVLGLFHSAAVVGVFFFASHLAQQVHILLAQNLAQVLLPSFSKLQEDGQRQHAAFLRASRQLMILGAPASFLVAALADPGIRLVFDARWVMAIPVVQALALGTGFTVTTIVTMNFVKAQGRYRFHLWLSAFQATVFLTFITVGAVTGAAREVGVAAGLAMALYSPLILYASLRGSGYGWRQVWQVYGAPVGSAGVAAGVAVALAAWVPPVMGRDFLRAGVTALAFGVLYFPLIRVTAGEDLENMWRRVRGFLPRRWVLAVPARFRPFARWS
jgi:O-antigen/teichoic acid export membrane protein